MLKIAINQMIELLLGTPMASGLKWRKMKIAETTDKDLKNPRLVEFLTNRFEEQQAKFNSYKRIGEIVKINEQTGKVIKFDKDVILLEIENGTHKTVKSPINVELSESEWKDFETPILTMGNSAQSIDHVFKPEAKETNWNNILIYYMENYRQIRNLNWGAPLGLKWRKVKNGKTGNGQEIINEDLTNALKHQRKFTQTEWDTFGIKNIREDSFVKSGPSYFEPSGIFKSSCSRQNYVSKIKRYIFDSEDNRKYHKHYRKTIAIFNQALLKEGVSDVCKEKALKFKELDFRMQYKMLQRHKRKEFCLGNKEVDDAFKKIKLVNARILQFKVSASDSEKCKVQSIARVRRKNRDIILVTNSTKYLMDARKILKLCADSNHNTRIEDLGFALMLTSGRRMAEIFNGRSKFTKGTNSVSAMFEGQLKTDKHPIYEIPLLCEFDDFIGGMDALRLKQGNWDIATKTFKNDTPSVLQLSNDRINARYSSNLIRRLRAGLFFPHSTNHDCRRFYIQATWKGYKYDRLHTFNTVAMQFLGHGDLKESLSYNYLVLDDFDDTIKDIFATENRLKITEEDYIEDEKETSTILNQMETLKIR